MWQRIFLLGNLTHDPEMRYFEDGSAVTNLRLATNERWTSKSGEQQERTTWFRISVWGPQAESCNKYLRKGRQVFVDGRLQPDDSGNPRVFQRSDGTHGSVFEVRALDVRFLGGKPSDIVTDDDEPAEVEEIVF